MARFETFLRPLLHATRMAIAAMAALLCQLPEAYWATITTLIIMQSTLGAALAITALWPEPEKQTAQPQPASP